MKEFEGKAFQPQLPGINDGLKPTGQIRNEIITREARAAEERIRLQTQAWRESETELPERPDRVDLNN